MERFMQVGYCDGRDIQGMPRDIPTLSVMCMDHNSKDITVLNVIQGERAKALFEELTDPHR